MSADTEALLAAAIHEAEGRDAKWPDWHDDPSMPGARAAAILATPSGQRLLAPTERERALTIKADALDDIANRYIEDHNIRPGSFAVWAGDLAVKAQRAALAAQPDAPEVAS